jgi:CDP-diacylglycerol--glycerol-3-phosphate 3-phosphatidyltransferase
VKINLPNQITIARFVLAIIFCVLLAQFEWRRREEQAWMIDCGLALFIIAAISDIVDGYIARKQNQVTSFGRVIDPFVDKILVCGAFVLLVGENFVRPDNGSNATGMKAWMVVLILGRELLVTGLRGFSEAKGTGYGANLLGKIKMWVQSVTVCVILASLTYFNGSAGFIELRQWFIWATVAITTGSLAVYLVQAKDILAEQSKQV